MCARPPFDRLDLAALLSCLGVLLIGYVIYPNQVVQYSAWLVVFTVWMAWFFYYGTKWLYGVEF